MHLFIRLIIGLLYVSNCFAQGIESPIDAFIPSGVNGCGKASPSKEHILNKGEGCRFVIRATKNYKNILKYKVVFRPVGKIGSKVHNDRYIDVRPIVSRTKIFRDLNNNGFDTVRFPMHGTGEYSVLIDSNNNNFFGEEAYLGWLYLTPHKLKSVTK